MAKLDLVPDRDFNFIFAGGERMFLERSYTELDFQQFFFRKLSEDSNGSKRMIITFSSDGKNRSISYIGSRGDLERLSNTVSIKALETAKANLAKAKEETTVDGYRLMEGEGGKSRLESLDRTVHQVEVLAKHGREVLDGCTRGLSVGVDRVHEELTTAVVVDLVGEETGAGATAKSAEAVAETAPAITEKKSEEESEDSASPTSEAVAEAVVAGQHPREVGIYLIAIRCVNYSVCHNK